MLFDGLSNELHGRLSFHILVYFNPFRWRFLYPVTDSMSRRVIELINNQQ
jgi:hypothetical protein